MEENTLRTEPSTGNAIDSNVRALRDWVGSELPSPGRPVQIGALAMVAVLGVVAIAWNPAVALLGLLAAAALVTAFARPYLLGPIVALLLPAGETLHVLDAQVAPLEAVVGGGAIGYLVGVATRREAVRFRVSDWAFLAFLIFVALSTLGPVDDSDRFRQLLFWGALAVVFHAVTVHLGSRRDLALLLVALAASTLLEASWALFEYFDRWSERFSLLDGAVVFPLPKGTLGHPNALAQFLVLGVLAVVALALAEAGLLRRVGFLVAGAGALALVVTFSRASWIALAVGSSVYLVERRTRRPVLAVGVLAGVGAAALALVSGGAIGARISSPFRAEAGGLYDFRLELIERAARSVAEHPLTGSGRFEEMGVYAGRPDLATHPHNLYLGLAVFFGIPAALAFVALVVLAIEAAARGYRARAARRRLTALGFVAVLVALLVNGLLEYPLWSPPLTALVVLVLAVAVALGREAPHERGSPGTTASEQVQDA